MNDEDQIYELIAEASDEAFEQYIDDLADMSDMYEDMIIEQQLHSGELI